MNIILKTKDLKLTPSIEEYVNKKLESLKKFIGDSPADLIRAEAEVGRTTRHHQTGEIFRAEFNLSVGGKLYRAESEGEDIYAAVDEARDDLEQQIKKFKNKQDTIFIRGARSITKKFRLSPLARFRKK